MLFYVKVWNVLQDYFLDSCNRLTAVRAVRDECEMLCFASQANRCLKLSNAISLFVPEETSPEHFWNFTLAFYKADSSLSHINLKTT